MIDFETLKALTIPEGEVVKITYPFDNLVESYQDGYRFNSSGGFTEQVGSVVTGFIPFGNKKFYIQNGEWGTTNTKEDYAYGIEMYTYVHFYDSNKESVVKGFNGNGYFIEETDSWAIITKEEYGWSFDLTGASFDFSYVRFSLKGSGSNLIITDDDPSGSILWTKATSLIDWAKCSINEDGSIYNNGLGYKRDYRIRSGGLEAGQSNCACTGFIPFKKGDTLRIYPPFYGGNTPNAINFADSGFTNLGQVTDSGSRYGICNGKTFYQPTTIDGVTTLTYSDSFDSSIAYVRITNDYNRLASKDPEDMIITINQEIEL